MSSYQILEDNGGGLHIFVFDDDDHVIDAVTNLEYAEEGEYNLAKAGLATDPVAEVAGWEGHYDDPVELYESMRPYTHATVVNDNGTLCDPYRMGAAALRYFGITRD